LLWLVFNLSRARRVSMRIGTSSLSENTPLNQLVLRYDLMADEAAPLRNPARFFLYVEGPSDRDIIRIWARSVSPHIARALDDCVVILGGRQPARAVDHMQSLGGAPAGVRGLCVLDRDNNHASRRDPEEPGLELFVWPRRHIESYLLVPDAICRCAGVAPGDSRVTRIVEQHLPSADDDSALEQLDAKRLLAKRGPLAAALGAPLSPARIARSMRAQELHADARNLIERLRAGVV
jgi:hypothetical protein